MNCLVCHRPQNSSVCRFLFLLIQFLALASPVFAQLAPAAPKRVALVIGNASYSVGPLRNPVNDARAMAEALGALGFDVKLYENLNFSGMRRAVAEFGERMTKEGVGLFYYSGHGIQVNGKNYLVPIGADIKSDRYIAAETLEVDSVLGQMDAARSGVNIVMLDACRDNPFVRQFRTISRGLAFMDAPVGSYIAYATNPGNVADDGEGQYGIWTGELLKALREPGLKIEDVFKRARQEVIKKTKNQQPWDASSLTGDFYFSAPQATAPPVSASPVVASRPNEQTSPASTTKKGEDGAEMVLIPAGDFWMGDENARRRVYVDSFWIDKYEVTNVLYKRFMQAAGEGRAAPRYWSLFRSNLPEAPVGGVDWNDAAAYCNWAGKRLPTEAEWEKAARGTDGRKYPWGDQWDSSRTNSKERNLSDSVAVGSYPSGASPYGIHDMAGNVHEWVADSYYYDFRERMKKKFDPKLSSPKIKESERVFILRGGSYAGSHSNLLASRQMHVYSTERAGDVGFRCAQ
jgi:formylglycine-generating enzyme required for sulfatase activity